MSIDLHEPAASARKAAKRARKQAFHGVAVARDVDLHGPAEAAKQVAKRATKRAAREASAAASRAARRKTKRAGNRLVRVTFGLIAVGAFVGLVVVLVRRMGATPPATAYVPPVPAVPVDEPLETAEV